jgi:hypothetical protein
MDESRLKLSKFKEQYKQMTGATRYNHEHLM